MREQSCAVRDFGNRGRSPGAIAPPFFIEVLQAKESIEKKTRLREWFGFALTFALFARDRRAPHLARSRKFPKKNRPRELEATFERKRDTRDFAHFSHLNRLNIKVAPDFSFFFVTAPVRKREGFANPLRSPAPSRVQTQCTHGAAACKGIFEV